MTAGDVHHANLEEIYKNSVAGMIVFEDASQNVREVL